MNVSICVGDGSQKIINAIGGMLDDVDFSTYSTLGSLAKDVQLKHIDMKRVIFTGKIITNAKKEFKEFHVFLKKRSPKTEVVLICNESDIDGIGATFKGIFSSPIYTVVVPSSANAGVFKDLVKSPISELAKKYSGGAVEVSAENLDGNDSDATTSQNGSNPGVSSSESAPNSARSTAQVYSRYRGTSDSTWESGENDSNEKFTESYQPAGVSEEVGFSGEDFSEDDDDLSIASFGSEHSDTGYLEDDDDLEIEDEVVETEEVDEKFLHESSIVNKVNDGYRRESTISANLNIDLVISTREKRATQAMIDEALSIYRKDSGKVLIIDLDTRENNILSYLQTGDFYRSSQFEGIRKQRIYEEDHISICSNGYGVTVTTKDLKSLLSSRALRDFDIILIDCPVDCLDVIDEELVNMCHVLVYTGGSRNDMASMTIGLTNRSVVKLGVEKYIMRNCEVEVADDLKKPDLAFLKKYTLFANGSWLDKVGA